MSNEMIRELSTTEIDMVSGALGFGGGFGLGGDFSFGTSFNDLTFNFGFEADILGGITSAIGGILGSLFGGLFGG